MRYIILLLLSFSALADTSVPADPSVGAETAVLNWVAPVEREDGSQLLPGEIGGFQILNTQGVQVGADIPAADRSMTLPASLMGTTVYMICFDTEGRQSAYSQPVIIPEAKTSPKAPTVTITFTINIEATQ